MSGWALTQIFKDNAWIAYVAFSFSIGLGAVCLIGLLIAHMKGRRIRSGLAAFIEEMDARRRQCATPSEPTPEIQDVADRLTVFLKRELGTEAIARINSDSGLPIHQLSAEAERARRWSG